GTAVEAERFIEISDCAGSVSGKWPIGERFPGLLNQVGEFMSDPISDFLSSIRNASGRLFEKVDIPASRLKVAIVRILKAEGFIANYKVMEDAQKHPFIRVYLKYAGAKQEVLQGVR